MAGVLWAIVPHTGNGLEDQQQTVSKSMFNGPMDVNVYITSTSDLLTHWLMDVKNITWEYSHSTIVILIVDYVVCPESFSCGTAQ